MKRIMFLAALFLPITAVAKPAQLLPNSSWICNTGQSCTIIAVSNSAATAQIGSAGKYTVAQVPAAYPITVQPGAITGTDPNPGTTEGIYLQQGTSQYTVSYTLAGVPMVATVPPAPINPCSAVAANWYGIGGGTPGQVATLPAGTIYKVAGSACTVAGAQTTVDISTGNLAIQQTIGVQQISVTVGSSPPNMVTVPSVYSAACVIINSVSFTVTPAGAGAATYTNNAPITVCP